MRYLLTAIVLLWAVTPAWALTRGEVVREMLLVREAQSGEGSIDPLRLLERFQEFKDLPVPQQNDRLETYLDEKIADIDKQVVQIEQRKQQLADLRQALVDMKQRPLAPTVPDSSSNGSGDRPR